MTRPVGCVVDIIESGPQHCTARVCNYPFCEWSGVAAEPISNLHASLLGLSDRDLLMRCGEATHQHFKGGLYRLLGHARDADTGEAILGRDGLRRVVYEHVYPHARQVWVRDCSEWTDEIAVVKDYGEVAETLYVPRFRQLGSKIIP